MTNLFESQTYAKYMRRLVGGTYQRSYSQQGEDLLIDKALIERGIMHPTYIDIGAYDPIRANNTYLFYKRGLSGVCVEPDPQLFSVLKRKRPHDKCLNAGIGPTDFPNAKFYVMTTKQLSTFSQEEAKHMAESGSYGSQAITKVLDIPIVSINRLLAESFTKSPDVLSIDTEGYDLDIVRALDFTRFAPQVMCIETLRYDEAGNIHKMKDIIDYVISKGYEVFADTHVNTIFARDTK